MQAQGVVKTYDPTTGFGVVVNDHDQAAVLLQPGSLAGSIFRFLRQGQRLIYDIETSEEGKPVATRVRVGQDGA